MLKTCSLALLFILISFDSNSLAGTPTLNWCGTYFEQNNQGFIRVPLLESKTGSHSCSLEEYNQRASYGSIDLALNFAKNRTTLNNWKKFNNHVIVIRGKIKNGKISKTRFVRDVGI